MRWSHSCLGFCWLFARIKSLQTVLSMFSPVYVITVCVRVCVQDFLLPAQCCQPCSRLRPKEWLLVWINTVEDHFKFPPGVIAQTNQQQSCFSFSWVVFFFFFPSRGHLSRVLACAWSTVCCGILHEHSRPLPPRYSSQRRHDPHFCCIQSKPDVSFVPTRATAVDMLDLGMRYNCVW